jgi:hemolysin activation/secretion protein
LNLVAVGQDLPLGRNGAKWGVSLLGSQTKADLSGVPVNSELSAFNLNLTYPWLRRRTHNLTLRGTFSAVTTNSDLDGLVFNQDRVRSARLGLTYDFVDRARGANVFDLEMSHGLDGFGANPTGSPNASRANGRSDYTKMNFYGARLQPIIARFSVLAAATAQYTDQPLLVPEQFALGGEQFLRAYDAAELLGDRGYGLKLELRYGLTASGSATAYGFYDSTDASITTLPRCPPKAPPRPAPACGSRSGADSTPIWKARCRSARTYLRSAIATRAHSAGCSLNFDGALADYWYPLAPGPIP